MSLYKVDFKPSALARSISKDTTNQHANPPGFNSNNGTKTTSEGSGGSGSGGTTMVRKENLQSFQKEMKRRCDSLEYETRINSRRVRFRG